MTLEFIGDELDVSIDFSLLWVETGLHFNISSYSYGDSAQEYRCTFPEHDYSGPININNSFDPLISDIVIA